METQSQEGGSHNHLSEWRKVISVEKIRSFGRPVRFIIEDKPVAVWYYNNTAYCISANCYHAGGKLENHTENIEEIKNNPCIRCPLHHHIISISTGEVFIRRIKIEEGSSGRIKKELLDYDSVGMRQRIHDVKIKDGDIYIRLNKSPAVYPSDQYDNLYKSK